MDIKPLNEAEASIIKACAETPDVRNPLLCKSRLKGMLNMKSEDIKKYINSYGGYGAFLKSNTDPLISEISLLGLSTIKNLREDVLPIEFRFIGEPEEESYIQNLIYSSSYREEDDVDTAF